MKYTQLMVATLAAVLFLSSCATRPDNIQGTYVSPNTYKNYNCREISDERNRISEQVNALTDKQRGKATGDAVAVGVGAVIFWPALFMLAAGSDNETQLASYKGHYDALTQAGITKKCFKE